MKSSAAAGSYAQRYSHRRAQEQQEATERDFAAAVSQHLHKLDDILGRHGVSLSSAPPSSSNSGTTTLMDHPAASSTIKGSSSRGGSYAQPRRTKDVQLAPTMTRSTFASNNRCTCLMSGNEPQADRRKCFSPPRPPTSHRQRQTNHRSASPGASRRAVSYDGGVENLTRPTLTGASRSSTIDVPSSHHYPSSASLPTVVWTHVTMTPPPNAPHAGVSTPAHTSLVQEDAGAHPRLSITRDREEAYQLEREWLILSAHKAMVEDELRILRAMGCDAATLPSDVSSI